MRTFIRGLGGSRALASGLQDRRAAVTLQALSAIDRIRTDTVQALNLLPLPVGLRWRILSQYFNLWVRRDSNPHFTVPETVASALGY